MHAIFYILDCQSNYQEVSLSTINSENCFITLNSNRLSDDTSQRLENSITIDIDPIRLCYLLRELEICARFRRKVIRYLQQCEPLVVAKVIAVDKGVLDHEW